MRKFLVLAAGLILLTVPALAQGGSPYNDAGQQAGGAAGGMGRRMGSTKAEDPNMAMPPRGSESATAAKPGSRKVTRKRSKKMNMKPGRMRGHAM
ncbi:MULTISPECIES: hypothetical protein [Methylorubrum]|nr:MULTISPECIES: hypothetical protein [Methylorubrum]MCP1542134.1 hypothetical protein [Methylorubrum extorquens]MCP1590521.1 hypothetical protein [Methylorubrum extorquens]